ncbi:MAG: DUF362 domain-containing protein [Desulfovibrionales bacterium]
MSFPVRLYGQKQYERKALLSVLETVLAPVLPDPAQTGTVLVKPNLVSGRNAALSCTHPLVVEAVCLLLREMGFSVRVGDSPAFGSAAQVAARCGLDRVLAPLDVPLVNLDNPVPVRLPSGLTISLSRQALETDCIVNIPRLKAHGQMRLSAAIKNLFGCVCGARKAMAHLRHGDKNSCFQALLVEIMLALPPAPSLVDGIVAMHTTGPIKGKALPLGLLGAARDPVPLDTALGTILGLAPLQVPLWEECCNRSLPGSRIEECTFPLSLPRDFDASGFITPSVLDPQRFSLPRIIKGMLTRAMKRMSSVRNS